MPESKNFVDNLRKYALIYGAGGVGALQALKMDLFSFPAGLAIYLSYLFSIITIFCIFFGGSSILDMIKKINEVVKKINEAEEINKSENLINNK